MKKIENLSDLFVEQSRELYSSNKQELQELPRLKKKAHTPALKELIDKQITTVQNQRERLRDSLSKFNSNPKGERCDTTKAIFTNASKLINSTRDAEVRDATIVNTLQSLNHRKMVGFGTTASFAQELDDEETAKLLRASLQEEKDCDHELTLLAEREINTKAVAPTFAL